MKWSFKISARIPTLVINSFSSETLPGSPQYIYFFKNSEEMMKAYTEVSIEDEFDHSFACKDREGQYRVLWRNRAGPIQFCGSGAYALAWYLLSEYRLSKLNLVTETQIIGAVQKSKTISISLMKKPVINVSEGLYFNTESGICFLQLESKIQLLSEQVIRDSIKRIESDMPNQVHGFCVFHWQNNEGFVRYFTPWHGRDEDYVTGSIHQYLSPLVDKLFNSKKQRWTQLSTSRGELQTMVSMDRVDLSGQCYIGRLL